MAKATIKNVQVTETKQVDIFQIVLKDGKYYIICGNAQIVQRTFSTMAKAETFIKSKPYELIFNTCLYLVNRMNEEQSKNK